MICKQCMRDEADARDGFCSDSCMDEYNYELTKVENDDPTVKGPATQPPTPKEDKIEARDEAWSTGNRAAWLKMFVQCLDELGYDDLEVKRASWILERENAVATLRSLCDEFGDNDWDEELSLTDIIYHHLGAHLQAPTEDDE